MRLLLLPILIFALSPCQAQSSTNKLAAEFTNFTFGAHIGPYRGRTPETDGPFNEGFSLVGQAYFPMQLSFGATEDNTTKKDEYANKLLLLRPSLVLHFVDNGAIAFGGAMQLSCRTIKQFYLEYQLGVVYLDANDGASPDLHDGTNLHHLVSISKPLNKTFTASLGYIHMSKGSFKSKTSNQDLITLGIRFHL